MSIIDKIKNWWGSLFSWWTPSEIEKEYKEGKKRARRWDGNS